MEHVSLLVVGAGPTGLGAARRLHQRGHDDWLVVEATGEVGGLARSVTDAAGFTYDIGGHVLFSHYDAHRSAVDDALAGNHTEIERRAWVRTRGIDLPYPFQLHLRHLPQEVTYECVRGLLDARLHEHPPATSFRDWIDATFGAGIAAHFMVPYNRKVWATALDRMSAGWIGERVAVVDLDRVLRNVLLGEDATDWGPNGTFRYPCRGGTGAIYEAFAAPLRDRIRFHRPLTAIDPIGRVAELADGDRIQFDRLLSTMPLDDLVGRCRKAPTAVRNAATRLHSIDTHVVGVGIDRPTDDPRTWIYFPDDDVAFHRVTQLSNYSPHLTPRPDQHILLAEVSRPRGATPDQDQLVAQVVAGLQAERLLGPDDPIVTTWHHCARKSYPVPTVDRDEALATVEPWLHRHGIASRGRLGAWRYEIGNMDHAHMQGHEWVDNVLDGRPETVWTPTCE